MWVGKGEGKGTLERKSSSETEKPSRVRAAGLQLDTDATVSVVRLLWSLLSVPAVGSLLLLSLWGRAMAPGHSRVTALPRPLKSDSHKKIKERGPNLEHVDGTFLLLKN